MFHDLDITLKGILGDAEAPGELRGAQASFLTPEKGYAPSENTVNLFLYDVKENRDLRDPVPIVERMNGVFVRRRPPLRVDCSYLVTAWSTKEKDVKVLEEHQLLGQAFLWLSRFPTIPQEYLQGSLDNPAFPLPPTMVAQMDGTRNTAEFWTALGIPPRPCFNLVVTIAMDLGLGERVGPQVIGKEIRLKQINSPADPDSLFEIGGTVTDAGRHAPIGKAHVTLGETGQMTTTDRDGRYRFLGIRPGNSKLQVMAEGYRAYEATITVPPANPDAYDISLTP